jgi:hypothetical protein
MKRFFFVLLFLLMASNFAVAETWEELVTVSGLKISIDKDSVRKLDSVIYGWQRWTYEQDQVFQGVTYRTTKSLIYTDCGKSTRANAHVLLLSEAGATLYERRIPAFAFAPLIPGTYPDMVHALICANYPAKAKE